MNIRIRVALLLATLVLVAGCATKPQQRVQLEPMKAGDGQKVGVALAKLPKPALDLPGANCLLCIMAAQVMNSQLARHTDTLDAEELKPVQADIADHLRKKGVAVTLIAEPLLLDTLAEVSDDAPNKARRDFTVLKSRYGVDKLVVISFESVGILRMYSAYVPTSDPRAFVRGVGYMVDLRSNTYDWYLPIYVARNAEGRWDEPPKYPGLTNAYFQALEESKDELLEPWKR
ncbi:MAG TPA: hypothetical protein VFE74_01470 [Ramlibacter sp.]|nr:hypothetical protein [Ramlibacter sp.]